MQQNYYKYAYYCTLLHYFAYFCNMIKEERLNLILSILSKDQRVLLPELSKELKVSEDTIRRDIKSLSERGLLKAVRGGAVPHSPVPRHYRAREHYDQDSKDLIAAKALQFLANGQVVLFDGGTSTLAVAASIPPDLRITIITNSFPIANALEDHPLSEVIFAGGRLDKDTFTTMGQDTTKTFQSIRADICFFGICSIHPTLGVTTKNYEEAQLKAQMVAMAKQTIALATTQKINTADPYYICPVEDIDTIITNSSPDHTALTSFKNLGVTVL